MKQMIIKSGATGYNILQMNFQIKQTFHSGQTLLIDRSPRKRDKMTNIVYHEKIKPCEGKFSPHL